MGSVSTLYNTGAAAVGVSALMTQNTSLVTGSATELEPST